MNIFKLQSKFKPAGDQPKAIKELSAGLEKGFRHQTLLGVTGSGKTFTMANVIAAYDRPTLVIAHNKTLAAQLAQEYRDFFPDQAVHYFVSYYDYYQPEAYLPITDTYIEKEAMINKEIDRLRHAATQSLLTRRDVIIVASVSCIYGLGSPTDYEAENIKIFLGDKLARAELIKKLIATQYERTTTDLSSGTFRVRGNFVEVMTAASKQIIRTEITEGEVVGLVEIDANSREIIGNLQNFSIFPAKHFVTSEAARAQALKTISTELKERLRELKKTGKWLEAERLKRRTNYDLSLIREVGYTNGIENYSRHLSGRVSGAAPDTLLSYFGFGSPTSKWQSDFLTVIDESHVTIPQLAGMYAGDCSRKQTLIENGFRLPSALDNRPLTFDEFNKRVGPIIYTSATPADYELGKSSQIVEQIIRPTGLVDPRIELRPLEAQVKNFIKESKEEIKKGGRVLTTTLTKKMAEDLSVYLKEQGVKAEYLHSEIKTIERIKILSDFRRGKFDCLVGVNLLREGLDLPEVSLIGILDADREGFLRSAVSLIQTIGRAARNVAGRVILYSDIITGSMKKAIDETNRRRAKQLTYNKKHKITPKTIVKNIVDISDTLAGERDQVLAKLVKLDSAAFGGNKRKVIREKEKQLRQAVKELDFETAALIRDEIKMLTVKRPKLQE